MPDWPSFSRLDDRRMAESLQNGDADALSRILDGYAPRLYDYCHALVRDRQIAAYALHDVFITAQAHIGKLRDLDRFRGWLYALARNECLRRLRHPDHPGERHEAPEPEDAAAGTGEQAGQAQARELANSALSSLTGRQREIIDLLLRHNLDTEELAHVIGADARETTDLAGAACDLLDDACTATMIARTGRGDCPSVAALVADEQWPLTSSMCRKLIRHVETCPTCSERRTRKISVTRLLKVLPPAHMPADLPQQVLATATTPELADERTEIAKCAGPFDPSGRPVALATASQQVITAGRGGSRILPAVTVAAAAASVAIVIGVGFALLPPSPQESLSDAAAPSAPTEPETGESVSVPISPREPQRPSPEPTPSASASASASATVTRRPAVRASMIRPSSSSPTTKSPTAGPTPGYLSVTGCGDIGTASSCVLTVTAMDGQVTWSVAGTVGVTASGSGTLASGESADIAVMVVQPACGHGEWSGSGTVTFSPSGSGAVSWSCHG